MKIYIGTDHAGFELKKELADWLRHQGYEVSDVGPHDYDKDDDYPDYAFMVARAVANEPDARGILICTSGQGMAIAANRVKGVRAALAWDTEAAIHSREHNDANVLSLPGKRLDLAEAETIIDVWLKEPFSQGERHIRRIKKIDNEA